MAKRRKKRSKRSSGVTKRCKMIKVIDAPGKADKVKIGARFYKPCKGKVMEAHDNGKAWVCPVGKTWKLAPTGGKLQSLCKAPKR